MAASCRPRRARKAGQRPKAVTARARVRVLKPLIKALASQIGSCLDTSETNSGVEPHSRTVGTRNQSPRGEGLSAKRYTSTCSSRRAPLSWKMARSSLRGNPGLLRRPADGQDDLVDHEAGPDIR